jgi:hypothetical protein
VVTERAEHRADARPANEGHDDVDAVGGVDLRQDLTSDPRLARRVREQRRVEERDERLRQGLRCAVRESPEDRAQHLPGLER